MAVELSRRKGMVTNVQAGGLPAKIPAGIVTRDMAKRKAAGLRKALIE